MRFHRIRAKLAQLPRPLTFLESLQKILQRPKEQFDMELGHIFNILAGRGYPALIVVCSLPFCLPITIPGLSTPFGSVLALMGLRIALGQRPCWPQWILKKQVKGHHVDLIVEKTIAAVKWLQHIVRPRLVFLTTTPILHRAHGVLIFLLSILLALPLPIPFTNTLSAIPIFCLGMGLLEDDGLSILTGYLLSTISFMIFAGLFLFGKSYLPALLGLLS